jgi:TRAP-type mannitol/chloroaromatic compound transport system permease small subunit
MFIFNFQRWDVFKALQTYVRYMDAVSRFVGKITMYLVFVMMAILLYSSISRTVFNAPVVWAVEMAQFTMAAYYILGGAFSMLLRSHVRMDVLYGKWKPRTRATVNAFTSFFLITYLVLLLYGGISSTAYSIQYGQTNYSAWAPPLAPIKLIMVFGILLMLLQAVATFIKDVAKARGIDTFKAFGETLP